MSRFFPARITRNSIPKHGISTTRNDKIYRSAIDKSLRSSGCACGGSCPACQKKTAGIEISQPADAAEIEADQIADKVMRMPTANAITRTISNNSSEGINRKCSACEEEDEIIQRKPISSDSAVPSQSPSHVSNAVSSGGRPLDLETRNFFEPRMGRNFGNVRIHTDSNANQSAQAIDAKAYSLGNNIVFGDGEYKPESESGRHLLAHELAHVLQHSVSGARTLNRKQKQTTCDPAHLSELGTLFNKSEEDVKKAGLKEIQLADEAAVAGAEDFVLFCPHKWDTPLNRLVPGTSVYFIQSGPASDKDQFWARQPGTSQMIWGYIKKSVISTWAYVKKKVETPSKDKDKAPSTPTKPKPQDPADTGERLYYFDLDQDSGMPVQTGVSLPNEHPLYVEKQTLAVGYGIYLGGYQLFCEGIEDKPILVPENYVDFSLKEATIASDVIYNSRAAALKAEADANASAQPGSPRRVAYYWGAGGAIVVPTVFSPATTPSTVLTMIKDRIELAEYVQNAMADLLISMIGGKIIGKIYNWAGRVGNVPVKTSNQILKEWKVPPPKAPPPPQLKSIPGGNTDRILMKDGKVVSIPPKTSGDGNRVLNRGDSAVPKTDIEVAPVQNPQLEVVPNPVPVNTPNTPTNTQSATKPTAGTGSQANPKNVPQKGPIPKPDPEWEEDNQNGCHAEAVAQRGGNSCHDQFATSVSGVSREWMVRTSEGASVDFDGLATDRTLYEIKTGYGFLLGNDSKNAQMREETRERFIDQSERQVLVAARCGYSLKWVFNNEQVANLVNGFIQPTVSWKKFKCDESK